MSLSEKDSVSPIIIEDESYLVMRVFQIQVIYKLIRKDPPTFIMSNPIFPPSLLPFLPLGSSSSSIREREMHQNDAEFASAAERKYVFCLMLSSLMTSYSHHI